MNTVDHNELMHMLSLACAARERAYAPYSGFRVGACLRASDGQYYLGCNIENAAYSVANCAERTALFTAVYQGARSFDALAVACSGERPAYPCGVCRQALSEFCDPQMPVAVCGAAGEAELTTLGALLPHAFGGRNLT